MFNLFKSKKSVKETIQQIHHEFETAGDNLIAEVEQILNGNKGLFEKAERLVKSGFKMANEVEKAKSIMVDKTTFEKALYYRNQYPLNKFITESQVAEINSKYGLVCGPVSRYKGFVPELKLKLIELFNLHTEDIRDAAIKLNYSMKSTDFMGIEKLRETYPDDIVPISLLPYSSARQIRGFGGGSGFISLESYDIIDQNVMSICAPAKDMDLSGLNKIGERFMSLTRVHVPDPVVLQPVKGGYLIVAAWGDEASDPIVVNEINN